MEMEDRLDLALRTRGRAAIFSVAQNGRPQRHHVHTQLMRAPRDGRQLHQRELPRHRVEHAVMRDGVFRFFLIAFRDAHPLVAARPRRVLTSAALIVPSRMSGTPRTTAQ